MRIGNIVVVVAVAVADAAAVHDHRVIEQRAFAVAGVSCSLPMKCGELLHVKAIDLGDLGLFLLAAAVVRQFVVAVVHADRRIAAVAPLVREHERGDAGRIGLKSHG